MPMLFVNLPVRDLPTAQAFYSALGFRPHGSFSDEQTAAFAVADDIALMLHVRTRFAEVVGGDAGDPTSGPTVVPCLTVDSREDVDRLVAAALEAGGQDWAPPREDDFRYTGSFTDPDGHVWQLLCMGQLHVVN